ncbi:uncharacterized protein LOC143018521 [Oratosquilla oratoria]|uniref:uncharacterized protein LOC143018521 n=1 Tax=Oratosquilla oratoria TaxID=337810 RepID=UPI003F76C3C3
MSDRPFDNFQHIILVKNIEIKKVEVKEAFRIANQAKFSFHNSIPDEWKNKLLDFCYDRLRKSRPVLQNKLKRKLKLMIKNSGWTKDANPNFVVNLSDKQLSDDASCALGYGLKFAYSNKELDYVEIAKSFSNFERYSDLSSEEVNIGKGIIYASLSNPRLPNYPNRFIKDLETLKKDKCLHITRADKANAVVILNRDDNLSKMDDLSSDDITYGQLKTNPLNKVNSE